jgi:ribose 5-phosphate isomerase
MGAQPAGPRGIEREKQIAAEAAAELVEDGMIVGLGTGSTVAFLLPALARRSLDIVCAATSPRTEYAARQMTPGVGAHGLFPPEMIATVLVGRAESVDRTYFGPSWSSS